MRLSPTLSRLAVALLLFSGPSLAHRPKIDMAVPMAPATIYVPDCPKPRGIFGFVGASDNAMGESACKVMGTALRLQAEDLAGKVKIISYAFDAKAPEYEVRPDLAAEASIGSRYRIVLTPTESYRVYKFDFYHIEAGQPFAVFDLASGKKGESRAMATPGGVKGAMEAAAVIVGLVRGADCDQASPPTDAHEWPKCGTHTTSLLLLGDEDDDDDGSATGKQESPSGSPPGPAPAATAAKPN